MSSETVSPRDYITLTQAAKLVPFNPNATTLWRWCRKGVVTRSGERLRLQHVGTGRRIATTAKWVEEFLKAKAASDAKHYDDADAQQHAAVAQVEHHRAAVAQAKKRPAERNHPGHAAAVDFLGQFVGGAK